MWKHIPPEIFIYHTNEGYAKTPYDYPIKTMKFADDGGKAEEWNCTVKTSVFPEHTMVCSPNTPFVLKITHDKVCFGGV